jgi:hypothetical protein
MTKITPESQEPETSNPCPHTEEQTSAPVEATKEAFRDDEYEHSMEFLGCNFPKEYNDLPWHIDENLERVVINSALQRACIIYHKEWWKNKTHDNKLRAYLTMHVYNHFDTDGFVAACKSTIFDGLSDAEIEKLKTEFKDGFVGLRKDLRKHGKQ